MRILFFANGFPPEIGGTEASNKELALQLARRGNEICVVTWAPCKESDSQWPFPVVRMNRNPGHHPYSCGDIPALIKKFKPDVAVISRTTRRLRVLPPMLVELGIPYVAYCHFLRMKHSNRDWIRRFLARKRFGFESASLVIGVSNTIAQQLVRMGIEPDKIRVVHPGIDPQRFRPDSDMRDRMRKELGFSDRLVILTVARLMGGKGQERVLKVLPRLISRVPNLMYCMVGGGIARDPLQAEVQRLGLQNHVHFTGPLTDPYPYYTAADVFTLPSNRSGVWVEAFGLSALEASACGLPVVASRESGAQEIVTHDKTGFLVDAESQEELFDALIVLLQDQQIRSQFGNAAREKAVRELTWSMAAEKLESTLRESASPISLSPEPEFSRV